MTTQQINSGYLTAVNECAQQALSSLVAWQPTDAREQQGRRALMKALVDTLSYSEELHACVAAREIRESVSESTIDMPSFANELLLGIAGKPLNGGRGC